jgi:hypothetical protein
MQDGLGNKIVLGKHYAWHDGDSIFQRIFLGKALSFFDDKATVGSNKVVVTNVHIRRSLYGRPDGDFEKENRADRVVYACILIPILTLAEYRNIQIDSILAED